LLLFGGRIGPTLFCDIVITCLGVIMIKALVAGPVCVIINLLLYQPAPAEKLLCMMHERHSLYMTVPAL
jgi:hypothetical protein